MARPPLTRIAGRLSGIHWDDLTTTERQIAEVLLESRHLVKDEYGNLLDRDCEHFEKYLPGQDWTSVDTDTN